MRKLMHLLALGAISILVLAFLIQCSDDNSPSASGGGLIVGDTTGTVLADHTFVEDFDNLPNPTFDSIRSEYNIFYGHTSHGSQIVSGLNMLYSTDAMYALPTFHEIGDDLGHNGDVSWVAPTRSWLNAHPEYNVVMWSWCGGMSNNSTEGINTYLTAMNQLEADYPDVIFIYMTGHLDGSGVDGPLYTGNNIIRDYCEVNGKILFDFADIESYDPDGTYYPDESDACNWCIDWCATHDCETCGGCAHSHCYNCWLKGKAFWTMMAQVYANEQASQ